MNTVATAPASDGAGDRPRHRPVPIAALGLLVAMAVLPGPAYPQAPAAPTNLVIVPSSGAGGTTFYVSPAGSDANPGTLALPFQTIGRARTAVRAVNGNMTQDIVVHLRGGTYEIPATLTFDQADSGTNGFRVIYSAYPGERPVVSGGQPITGWTPVGNGIYRASAGTLRFRQLYVNGVRAIRARTPNVGSYYQLRSWDEGNRRVEIASNEIGNWQRLNQVEMVVLKHWYQNNLRVASFSVAGSSAFVVPAEPERTRSFTQTHPQRAQFQPFYFENALELLDAPGEWYLDTTSGEVFYKPRPGEDLATAVVVAPRLEQLLRIQGTLSAPAHHLHFQGLEFAYSTWLLPSNEGFIGDQASIVFTQPQPADEIASYNGHRIPGAVHLEAANNVVFDRNVFQHMGASAVVFYMGTQDNRFTGNVITDVSASGISIDLNLEGNPSDSRKIPRRDVVRNNYVSQVAQEYFGNVGIFTGYTDAVVVEHNEVSDVPYTGISIGWGWADRDSAMRNTLVRYNRIWNVVNLLDDGAGVYTLSKQPGTIVAENYIHDVIRSPWSGGHIMGGIYLDQGSNLITVRDNVLQNNVAPIVTNAPGGGNTFVNNGGASPTTIANSGLEPAYHDIRPSP